NMGGWDFVDERILEILAPDQQLHYCGRPWSASTASGAHSRHQAEQRTLVEAALTGALKPARNLREQTV
ncbi:MAG: hypothetical protein V3T77_01840, partial [Planctomycetota bacterium]